MEDEERIKQIKAIKELYPHLSDEECEKAADALDEYLTLAWEIWEGERKQDI